MDDAALTSRYASELAEAVSLRPQLLRFVHSELRVRFDAEDIVQETYVRLYNYQTTRQVANVPAFCFATARNLIRDHFQRIRKSSLEETLPEALACPMPLIDEVLDYRERVEVLVRALRSMPQLRREIFLRNRLDGHQVSVIASELAMTRSAVDKHVGRALADLRHALAKRGLWIGGAGQ